MSTDITTTAPAGWVTSLIRTYVPIGVGAVLAWLLARGLGVDPESQTDLISGLTALGAVLWYGLLRWVEPHLPAWARAALFFSTKMPIYRPPTMPTVEARSMIDPDSGQLVEVYVVTDA